MVYTSYWWWFGAWFLIVLHTWSFPKIYPQIIHFNGIFHYKPSISYGFPMVSYGFPMVWGTSHWMITRGTPPRKSPHETTIQSLQPSCAAESVLFLPWQNVASSGKEGNISIPGWLSILNIYRKNGRRMGNRSKKTAGNMRKHTSKWL